MSIITDLFRKSHMSNLKEKEYEENDRIVSRIDIKKKSHYEREMIGILEKERQEALKEALRLENRRRIAEEKLIGRNMMSSNIHLLQ